MITLRPYQNALIEKTRSVIASGKRAPLLCSPCGSGKTVMFSYFAAGAVAKGNRVLILAHRDELLDQIARTLVQFNVRHSFIAAGRHYDPRDRVHVGSVMTVAKRVGRIPTPDIIINDEAHRVIKDSVWGRTVLAYPKAYILGVTATPCRLGGEALGDIFDSLVMGPTVQELIKIGALCPYRLYVPSTINTAGVHTTMGDYAQAELAAACDKPSITGDALTHYRRLADGKRAVAYTVSVAHAEHVVEQFNAAGYRWASLDGKMDKINRRHIVERFRRGDIQGIASCNILSEGFDLPAIEVGIMLRPTVSLSLHLQQSGRTLRPFEGKSHAIILDHSGNALRHGLVDDDREWSLSGKKKCKGETRSLSIATCKSCFAAMRSGATVCQYCGATMGGKPREVEEKEGELKEVDIQKMRLARMSEEARCQTLEDFQALGKRKGYHPGWAYHRWRGRTMAQRARRLA